MWVVWVPPVRIPAEMRFAAGVRKVNVRVMGPDRVDTFNAHAGEVCISAITLAELLHGAEKSGNPNRTRPRVEDFTSQLNVLRYGERAAVQSRW